MLAGNLLFICELFYIHSRVIKMFQCVCFMLGKRFNIKYFSRFFLLFPENRLCLSCKTSQPIFREQNKKKYIANLSSVLSAQRVVQIVVIVVVISYQYSCNCMPQCFILYCSNYTINRSQQTFRWDSF